MRTLLVLVVSMSAVPQIASQTVAEWLFTAGSTITPLDADYKDGSIDRAVANVTDVTVESPESTCSGNSLVTTSWDASSFDNFEFLSFAVQVGTGSGFTLQGFSSDATRTGNGPSDFRVILPVGFSSLTLLSGTLPAGSGCTNFAVTGLNLDIPAGANFQIQLHAWNAKNRNGKLRLDNVRITGDLPLPIELGDFSAQEVPDGVLLEWTTLQEQDNDYVAVERSANGVDFREIGRQPGHGNSQSLRSYQFTDHRPLVNNYYRLRQVDFDGSVQYYPTIYTRFSGSKAKIHAWPNPARDQLYLQSSKRGHAHLNLVDAHGTALRHWEQELGYETRIDVSALGTGMYTLSIRRNGRSHTLRFFKR